MKDENHPALFLIAGELMYFRTKRHSFSYPPGLGIATELDITVDSDDINKNNLCASFLLFNKLYLF